MRVKEIDTKSNFKIYYKLVIHTWGHEKINALKNPKYIYLFVYTSMQRLDEWKSQ